MSSRLSPFPHALFSRTRYDSIIIGARPAGAATARHLAAAGQRVLVVDRGAPDDDAVSTHALMRLAIALLHRWGVLDHIVAAGTPALRTTTFHYGERVVPVAIKPRDGIDALFAPRRTLLDPLLVAAAREAGAEVHHHAKLVALVREPTGRVAGAVIEAGGATHVVHAELVIGADGLGSAVARAVDAPLVIPGRHATATIYAHVEDPGGDGYRWYFRPGASAGVVPTNGGACVFVVVPAERYRAELRYDLDAGFRRVLAEAAPELAPPAGPLALRPFAGRTGYLRRAHGPGWALVGDAGFFRDPLTAHGITDALRDATLLGQAVAARGAAGLPGYEAARDSIAVPLLAVAEAIASFGWTLDELEELHRRLQRESTRGFPLVEPATATAA